MLVKTNVFYAALNHHSRLLPASNIYTYEMHNPTHNMIKSECRILIVSVREFIYLVIWLKLAGMLTRPKYGENENN